jgi:hypothetical protein
VVSSTAARLIEEQLKIDENKLNDMFEVSLLGDVHLKGFQAVETLYQVIL